MNPAQLTLAAFASVAIAAATAHPAAAQGALTVAFEEIKIQKGAIMVALFDTETAFESGAPVKVAMIPANAVRVATTMTGLAPGRYAIKAFHDIDGDGKMGANLFGVPTEPFAFSNNAVATMGPARWPAAAFTLGAVSATHTMSID